MESENILYRMQPVLAEYCNVVTQITKTVVAVIDDQQVYMLYEGGKWRNSVGDKYERANIAGTAMKTGEAQVLLEPLGHPACKMCKFNRTCRDIAEMWVPIIVLGRVVGVIGFLCETVQQRERFLKEYQTYLSFLKQIANLIALESLQFLEAEKNDHIISLLETVIKRLDSGVIVLNRDNGIAKINRAAQKILCNIFVEQENPMVAIESVGTVSETAEEYVVTSNDLSQSVVGKLYEINIGTFSKILLFHHKDTYLQQYQKKTSYAAISGTSYAIKEVKEKLKAAANSPSNILIYAEDGLGKELYARAIHEESSKKGNPFIMIDCEALPSQDVEQYLFGTANTSMRAGSRGKAGILESCDGGTLFFDNISKLSVMLQQKLIPFFERKEIVRVGSKKSKKLNVHIIASTSENLKELSEVGDFNKNLFYLIDVFPITVPPLRQRKEDIRPMAIDFINFFASELGKKISRIDEGFWDAVENYEWLGNARELRSAMEFVVNRVDPSGIISADLLHSRITTFQKKYHPETIPIDLNTTERIAIAHALQYGEAHNLSRANVASILGIGEATLYRKIKKYNL